MEAPASPSADPSPGRIHTGEILALAGASLVLFSVTLGWMTHPFAQEGGVPFRPSQVEVLPFLLRIRTLAWFPTVGQLIVVLGLLAAAPPVLGLHHRGWDLARRIAGLLTLVVVVLFPFGYDFIFRDGPPDGLLGSVRLGILVAALGGLLVVIGGRRLGRSAGPEPESERKRISTGAVLAFLGLAALAFSVQMTWVDRGFIPEGTPDPGILGGDVPLLPLIVRTAEAQIPTVGHAFMALVIGGAFLLFSGRRGPDLTRRFLGLLALIVCGLFAFRTQQLAEFSGSFDYTMIGLLRMGFLVAVLGGILNLVVGGSRADRPI